MANNGEAKWTALVVAVALRNLDVSSRELEALG